MRRIKAMLGILVATLVLVSGFMVLAADESNCSKGIHYTKIFCEQWIEYQEKTGEHEATLDNGKKAVCYIYTEYYVIKYRCKSCGAYIYETQTVRNVHSLTHK